MFFVGMNDGAQQSLCSAALITPRLLLTAAHCATGQWTAVDCDETTFSAPLPPETFRVTHAPNLQESSNDLEFVEIRSVELAAPGASLCGHDWALLELHDAVDQVAPLPVGQAPEQGSTYRLIGYGYGHASGVGEGVRRTSDFVEVECVGKTACSRLTLDGSAGAGPVLITDVVDGEWVGPVGACPGDSGGPALDPSGAIIGVASRGYDDCRVSIFSTLDRPILADKVRIHAREHNYPAPDWAQEDESSTPGGAAGSSEGGASAQGTGGGMNDSQSAGGALMMSNTDRTSHNSGCACYQAHRPSNPSPFAYIILSLALVRRRLRS